MKRFLIETSVIVSYLRGNEETVEAIDNLAGEFSSSFVCLAELYEGIYRVKDTKKAEQGVLDFFTGLSEVYGLDKEIAQQFGKVRAELKKKGKVIEDLDILISATCLAHRLILVTYNPGHFQRVKNLDILVLSL